MTEERENAYSMLICSKSGTHHPQLCLVRKWNDTAGGQAKQGSHLSDEQAKELDILLARFESLFTALPGHTTLVEHHVTTGDAKPVRLRPYRIPQAFQESVKQELAEMLKHGIIEPSTSSWAFPLVAVRKKDSTLRLCVDYRRLNILSTTDPYPMPRVDDLIEGVGRATFITTLDLTKGYWQVPVAPTDREKTAFTTTYGHYQFKRMPFRLQGAPTTLQRMVDKLLKGLSDFCGAYLDDVVIFSHSWEDHMKHLAQVFQCIHDAGLTLKRKKCQFAMPECIYLKR